MIATSTASPVTSAPVGTSSASPTLEGLSLQLIQATAPGRPATQAIGDLLRLTWQLTQARGVALLTQDDEGRWLAPPEYVHPTALAQAGTVMNHCCQLAALSLQNNRLELGRPPVGEPVTLAAVPLVVGLAQRTVLVALFDSPIQGAGLKRRLSFLQVFAPLLVQLIHRQGQIVDRVYQTERVVLRSLIADESQQPHRATAQKAIDQLARTWNCQQLFVGRGRSHLKLEFVANRPRFDQHAELSRLVVSVMEQGRLSVSAVAQPTWIPLENITAASTLRHQCTTNHLWLLLWRPDPHSEIFALLGCSNSHSPADDEELRLATEQALRGLGSWWQQRDRAWTRPTQRIRQWWRQQTTVQQRTLAAISTVVLAAVLSIPMPYRIHGTATLQPVQRRYVAVPYEGRLDKTYVEPGDLVAEGQLLARMDSREIEWKLSGLQADYEKAQKQRDSALAELDTSNSQMAKLEMERLALQIRLLEEQAANLEIKSPIRGLVVSGDPQKLEGSRLAMGQTIVEIAPLDEMIVEIGIPDRDIHHLSEGAKVKLRFDAAPGVSYDTQLERIHPRAEQRDGKNVFIGSVQLDNAQGDLRPGMNGKARILGHRHALAWNLFHGAWDQVRFWTMW